MFIDGIMTGISFEVSDRIATITLNRPATLNALTAQGIIALKSASTGQMIERNSIQDYDDIGEVLREADQREDVLVTLVQGAFERSVRMDRTQTAFDRHRPFLLFVSDTVEQGTRMIRLIFQRNGRHCICPA